MKERSILPPTLSAILVRRCRLIIAVLGVTSIVILAALFHFLQKTRIASPAITRISVQNMPIPPFKYRRDLSDILEVEHFETGVELGVQRGIFAEQILSRWKSAKQYVLVDLWSQQQNYKDRANFENSTQATFKKQTLRRMEKFQRRGTKVEVCQDYTTECATRYRNMKFDYIYVDARHDYKGVMQDLEVWWPLLKEGGIMAGHDYVTNNDGPKQGGQDWSINYDGTRDPQGRAVKGAVDEFMNKLYIQISVSYREASWNTWAVRKPFTNPDASLPALLGSWRTLHMARN